MKLLAFTRFVRKVLEHPDGPNLFPVEDMEDLRDALAKAVALHESGDPPTGPAADAILEALLEVFGRARNRFPEAFRVVIIDVGVALQFQTSTP